MYVLNKNTRA